MDLLKEEVPAVCGAKRAKDPIKKEVLESIIKKAFRKRASYIKFNSKKMTMAMLRRLLEKDLKLKKYSLDPHKKYIYEQLDEVISPLKMSIKNVLVLKDYEASKHATTVKRKNLMEKSDAKTPRKHNSAGASSDLLDSEADEEEEAMHDEKKAAPKRNLLKSEAPKKRKRVEEARLSAKKETKPAETDSPNDSDKADSEVESDDGQAVEKPVKKKGGTAPAYGKRVEHLKSVIKSCGMSIPPMVYRKVKEGPEELREANLIKQLQQMLAKEGLSFNPSGREIKEVKRRKERAKELEGIDTSNIVTSSRRRLALSCAPPPKQKIPYESESDESEDSEDESEDYEKDGNDEGGEGEEQQEEEEEDNDNEENEDSSSEYEDDDEEESD